MIKCPHCGAKHMNLNLSRGQSTKCGAPLAKGGTCLRTLTHRNRVVDDRKYDKYDFVSFKPKVKSTFTVIHVGRSKAAPPITTWPFASMSKSVTYVSNTTTDTAWTAPAASDIRLPFKALNILQLGLHGLVISCPALNNTPSARAHFDAITQAMASPKKAQDITEAVGEAAAAMCVMAKYPGYELLWGFDVHSGAGIDQIWWDQDASNPHYLVVEAKGPGAGLSSGALGNPSGYEQMEKLWVIDRLGRMRSGAGATLANRILADLALDVVVALPYYNGGSKSYYGCQAAKGKVATATVSGLTVTARWLADGMLDGSWKTHAYTFP